MCEAKTGQIKAAAALLKDGASCNQAAEKTGLSRRIVQLIAKGDYDWRIRSAEKIGRCGECGAKVKLPCKLCGDRGRRQWQEIQRENQVMQVQQGEKLRGMVDEFLTFDKRFWAAKKEDDKSGPDEAYFARAQQMVRVVLNCKDRPEECNLLVSKVQEFHKALNDLDADFHTQPYDYRLAIVARLVGDLQRVRERENQPLPSERRPLESTRELYGIGQYAGRFGVVPVEEDQICRMCGFLKPDGTPDLLRARRDRDTDGGERTAEKGWVDPRDKPFIEERRRELIGAEVLDIHVDAEEVSPPQVIDENPIEELLALPGMTVEQVARMKGMTVDDVLAYQPAEQAEHVGEQQPEQLSDEEIEFEIAAMNEAGRQPADIAEVLGVSRKKVSAVLRKLEEESQKAGA